jgi:hypothetical protein
VAQFKNGKDEIQIIRETGRSELENQVLRLTPYMVAADPDPN